MDAAVEIFGTQTQQQSNTRVFLLRINTIVFLAVFSSIKHKMMLFSEFLVLFQDEAHSSGSLTNNQEMLEQVALARGGPGMACLSVLSLAVP